MSTKPDFDCRQEHNWNFGGVCHKTRILTVIVAETESHVQVFPKEKHSLE